MVLMRDRGVFFATEEFHAVVPAKGAHRDGLPWRDNRGIWTCFRMIRMLAALTRVLLSQVWARGDLPFMDFPVLSIWISLQETGARLDHREKAGSKHLPSSV